MHESRYILAPCFCKNIEHITELNTIREGYTSCKTVSLLRGFRAEGFCGIHTAVFYTIPGLFLIAFYVKKNLKQSWLHAFWKKRKIQNTQEIKTTLFPWTKQDKTCTFSRKSSSSSYVQQKKTTTTDKQTTNSTYLVSVRCSEAGGRKRKISWINCFFLLPFLCCT